MKPNDETEALLNRARTAGAMRLINKMFADGILEKVGNGFRPINPRLWRNKPWDKNYNALRRDVMAAWDQDEQVRTWEIPELVGHSGLERCFIEYFDKHPDADEGLMRACMFVWGSSALERASRADLADVEFLAEVMRRVQCKAMDTLAAARLRKARRLKRSALGAGGG